MKSSTVFFLAILLALTACQGGKRNVRHQSSSASSMASVPGNGGLSSAGTRFVQALQSQDMASAYEMMDERVKQKNLHQFTKMNTVIEEKVGKIESYAPTGVIQANERVLKDGTRQKEHAVWYTVKTSNSKNGELRLKVIFNDNSSTAKVLKYNFVRKARKAS